MAKKYIKYFIFIAFELFLFAIIVFLFIKIVKLYDEKVKGVQYVTSLKKEDFILSQENTDLKYFYEPKPNNVEVYNPDWLRYEARNTINSDTFNERYDYPVTKNEDTYRIITIGDSFTFGQHVNTSENYPEQLEDLLNTKLSCQNIKKIEVINLGVSGYDLKYSVERFIKRGLKYNPDLVIWLINSWNFEKIADLYFPLKKDMFKSQNLSEDYPVSKIELEKYNLVKGKALERIQEIYGVERILEYQRDVILQMLDIYHGKLLFVTFPLMDDKYQILLTETGKNNSNISVIEITDLYKERDKYILPDNHPSVYGYQIIANDIYKYLLTSKILTYCSD